MKLAGLIFMNSPVGVCLLRGRPLRVSGCQRAAFSFTLIGVLWLSGCKKADTSAPSTPPQASADTNAPETPYQAVQSSPPGRDPNDDEPLNLNREVRRWVLRYRRLPKNFEDFAANSGLQIPPPPAGKKYVLDKKYHVILAPQ